MVTPHEASLKASTSRLCPYRYAWKQLCKVFGKTLTVAN